MIKNKDGFSFVETIVMCAILMVGLLFVYKSYTSSINVQKLNLKNDRMSDTYKLIQFKKYMVENYKWQCMADDNCPTLKTLLSMDDGLSYNTCGERKTCTKDEVFNSVNDIDDCKNLDYSTIRKCKANICKYSTNTNYCCLDECQKSLSRYNTCLSNLNNYDVCASDKNNYYHSVSLNTFIGATSKRAETLYNGYWKTFGFYSVAIYNCKLKELKSGSSDYKNYFKSMKSCVNENHYRIVGIFKDDNSGEYRYAWIEFPLASDEQ